MKTDVARGKSFPVTRAAWARLCENVAGLRRDRGRELVLKGIDKVMNNDPSPADREHVQTILRALVAMNDAEAKRFYQ